MTCCICVHFVGSGGKVGVAIGGRGQDCVGGDFRVKTLEEIRAEKRKRREEEEEEEGVRELQRNLVSE